MRTKSTAIGFFSIQYVHGYSLTNLSAPAHHTDQMKCKTKIKSCTNDSQAFSQRLQIWPELAAWMWIENYMGSRMAAPNKHLFAHAKHTLDKWNVFSSIMQHFWLQNFTCDFEHWLTIHSFVACTRHIVVWQRAAAAIYFANQTLCSWNARLYIHTFYTHTTHTMLYVFFLQLFLSKIQFA